MALNVKVGTFNVSSASGVGTNIAVTGVGFQPTVVLFFWSGTTLSSPGTQGDDISAGWGAMMSSTNRFSTSFFVNDAAATTASGRSNTNARCVKFHANGTTTEAGGLDAVSMDSDGFTVTYDVVFSVSTKIHYIALGGSDLTNAAIGFKNMPTVTGNFSTTGVGFQPDALLVFCAATNAVVNQAVNATWSMGMSDGTTQGVVAMQDDEGVATTNTWTYAYMGEIVAVSSSINTLNMRASLVSMDADGFTMNMLEVGSNYGFFYVALKGGRYKVGTTQSYLNANNHSISVGFQPKGIIFASHNRAQNTQDIMVSNATLSFGAATSPSERLAIAVWDEDNLSGSETSVGWSDAAIYLNVSNDATDAAMDLVSIDSDGFTTVMDTVEPVAGRHVMYMAFGDARAATPVFYRHLQTQGIA